MMFDLIKTWLINRLAAAAADNGAAITRWLQQNAMSAAEHVADYQQRIESPTISQQDRTSLLIQYKFHFLRMSICQGAIDAIGRANRSVSELAARTRQ